MTVEKSSKDVLDSLSPEQKEAVRERFILPKEDTASNSHLLSPDDDEGNGSSGAPQAL